MTNAERWLRGVLIGHAVLSALLAIGYLVDGDTRTLVSLPNSFAKDMLFVALSVIGASDVRRFGWMALVIAFGYVALIAGELATLLWGGAPPLIDGVSATATLLGWMAIDVGFVALFALLWLAAARARYDLKYLNPIAYRGLEALAEVLVEGREEAIPPAQVARNVDGYLDALESRGKARVRLALTVLTLWPLLTARPPLPLLAPDTRRKYLKNRFVDEVAERRAWRLVRRFLSILIRTGSQMSYLGYYGDRSSWRSIGYTVFAERAHGRPQEPGDHLVDPLVPLPAPPRGRYDTVVIGSGAAGGIIAYRLAEAGRKVLVLERGPHVDPRTFTDDEVGQYLKLYNEGALQLATDFGLQVLQGMCVGGGTTINNALCLRPPELVLEAWEPRGVDREELKRAIEVVRGWFRVAEIPERLTTDAARRFKEAIGRMDLPGEFEIMEANISPACLGTGYCNIGCGYGAKITTLDTVLPLAQQKFGLELLADAEVERIEAEGRRAIAASGHHRPTGQGFTIEADQIVVAAGAIGSSALLQRSRIGGDEVGKGLHFNINSPLTADFPDRVDAFDGIQMSHAYRSSDGAPRFLIETWFNPPATQALAMPGWFDRHFENMQRYRHMACSGVLVGTTTPGRVKDGNIDYTASDEDRKAVVEGLQVAARIWFEAGADRVMPATFAWQEYTDVASLAKLPDRILESGDLLLTSAHPQGGNALGEVVEPDFRVRGWQGLYVCDASVFPSSVHVNPQLTVMGMAQYAAQQWTS